MSRMKRAILASAARIIDVVFAPLTVVGGCWFWLVRRIGMARMPASRKLLRLIGILPVRNHYYEPLVDASSLRGILSQDRELPALAMNVDGQLALLERFSYQEELLAIPNEKPLGEAGYYYRNGSYDAGDAEFLYSIIRLKKPSQILEVGSGFSTLIAARAIGQNRIESPDYQCRQICIEPYEQPWLSRIGVELLRKRIEDIDPSFITNLQAGDILFIDSSHVIRPRGDVLHEYLQLLPLVKPGVLVHIHDIFTPKDYPEDWVIDESRLWNEQYLLEAFLCYNPEFRVVGALNYLAHHHPDQLAARFPRFRAERSTCEPGAFWMERV